MPKVSVSKENLLMFEELEEKLKKYKDLVCPCFDCKKECIFHSSKIGCIITDYEAFCDYMVVE